MKRYSLIADAYNERTGTSLKMAERGIKKEFVQYKESFSENYGTGLITW